MLFTAQNLHNFFFTARLCRGSHAKWLWHQRKLKGQCTVGGFQTRGVSRQTSPAAGNAELPSDTKKITYESETARRHEKLKFAFLRGGGNSVGANFLQNGKLSKMLCFKIIFASVCCCVFNTAPMAQSSLLWLTHEHNKQRHFVKTL